MQYRSANAVIQSPFGVVYISLVSFEMPCSRLTSEDYQLWSLGLAEPSCSELIQSHLDNGCPTCTEAVRASFELWATFGAAAGPEAATAPSPRVRERLLAGARRTQAPVKVPAWRSRLIYGGAIAASLLVGVVGARWHSSVRQQPQPQVVAQSASPQLEVLKQQVGDLQGKLDSAEKELESLTRTRTASVTPIRLSQTPAEDCSIEVDRALNEAGQQIQQLRATLSGEQAKSARLAQEFDQQAAAVSTLTRDRRDAEANLAAANGRLAERDRQIKVLDAKLTQLERERDKLNDSLSNQKKRIDHATRLVALISTPSAKLVRLAGTEAAPAASGYALLSEGQKLMFTGSNLPGLQPDKSYQLWLMRGRSPGIVSAGVFGGAQMTIELNDAALLHDVKGLAVTVEPKGGSPLPTGHKLLVGTAKT